MYETIVSNGFGSIVINRGGVIIVKSGAIFSEFHDTAILLMHEEGGFNCGVHGNAVALANGSHGQDVGERLCIVPNLAEIREVADQV